MYKLHANVTLMTKMLVIAGSGQCQYTHDHVLWLALWSIITRILSRYCKYNVHRTPRFYKIFLPSKKN